MVRSIGLFSCPDLRDKPAKTVFVDHFWIRSIVRQRH